MRVLSYISAVVTLIGIAITISQWNIANLDKILIE